MLIKQHYWAKGIIKQMVQDAIEALLRQKLGLDANSVGSRLIERAVEQRQIACQITNRATYLAHLRSSPDEMNQLVEAVVVPETWFFRDREPFEYLRQYVKQPVKQPVTTEYQRAPGEIFRVLSLPCSTGEEPYSIAITLLEAGLKPAQFQVDAIDVSQQALLQAQRGVYRKKSFRGGAIQHLEQYFQPQTGQPPTEGYTVRSVVQESVKFRQGNVLNANLLLGRQYHAIFCRNLLIYLDEAARHQVMTSLDRALLPLGLLFLGSAETTQINPKTYQSIDHPFAFAFRKLPHPSTHPPVHPPTHPPTPSPKPPSKPTSPRIRVSRSPSPTSPRPAPPRPTPHAPTPSRPHAPTQTPLLETAQQLADRGELTQAAQLCESFLRVNPTQPIAYLLLGQIYQGLNQTHQAERCFQKAVYLNPYDYEALIYLALLKEQQGNPTEAERLRRRAQQLVDRGQDGENGRSGDEDGSHK